jgi:hypothetical protein
MNGPDIDGIAVDGDIELGPARKIVHWNYLDASRGLSDGASNGKLDAGAIFAA